MKSNIKALIFDMDGVILDSEPLHLMAYQQILSRYGIKFTAKDNQEFLGRKDLFVLETLSQRWQLDKSSHILLQEKEDILTQLLKKHAKPNPGLLTVLKQGQKLGIKMTIASSATLPTIKLVVEVLALQSFFEFLTSGDEVKEGKPAPDVFLLAAARLNVEPRNCLVLEDTLNGIKAAKAAGMRCVAIPCNTTRYQDHSLADCQLESLEELDLFTWCIPSSIPR